LSQVVVGEWIAVVVGGAPGGCRENHKKACAGCLTITNSLRKIPPVNRPAAPVAVSSPPSLSVRLLSALKPTSGQPAGRDELSQFRRHCSLAIRRQSTWHLNTRNAAQAVLARVSCLGSVRRSPPLTFGG